MKNKIIITILICVCIVVSIIGISMFLVFINHSGEISVYEDVYTPSIDGNKFIPGDYEVPENEKEEKRTISITAVGDILLGRGVGGRIESQNLGYQYPFAKVEEFMKADIVFGNLEEPITDSTHSFNNVKNGGKYILKNNPESIEAIRCAKFNVFSLANNHILDFYEEGLTDTINILDENNIHYAGAGMNLATARKPAIIEKNGLKTAVFAYTDMAEIVYRGNPQINFLATDSRYGVAPRKMEYILEDIDKVKNEADLIIVSLHWGVEDSFNVQKEQREFAYKLLDSGVDIILGHHPHRFQGIEIYKGKPIIYSMGNLIFDQNDPENQEGFIVKMQYQEKKLIDFYLIPFRVIGKTQVVPVYNNDSSALLERQKTLSQELNTQCEIKEGMIYYIIN